MACVWCALLLAKFALSVQSGFVKVVFDNLTPKTLDLYFVPDKGEPQWKDRIPPRQNIGQDTWVGHKFMFATEGMQREFVSIEGGGRVLLELLPSGKHLSVIPEWTRPSPYNGPKWDALVMEEETQCLELYTAYPEDAAHFCNPKIAFTDQSGRLRSRFNSNDTSWRERMDKEHDDRKNKIASQPQTLTNFTKVGFKVIKAGSPDLQRELHEFWRNGRRTTSKPENHPEFDPNLSCRESNTWLLELTDEFKKRLVSYLAPIVAEWSNVDISKLIPTATYGIRLYTHDSVLYTHLDRRDTHVLSVIWEIGYLGFSTPGRDEDHNHAENWPLEITDHAGNKHMVRNRPGQLILYESATCAHGRPTKYQGRESAGIFIHFAPKGWPEDYVVHKDKHGEL